MDAFLKSLQVSAIFPSLPLSVKLPDAHQATTEEFIVSAPRTVMGRQWRGSRRGCPVTAML